jgi:putative transferase (TIGR04331 family)
MKANFLVSALPKARIQSARELFITDPYVKHALEVSGELARYEKVVVAYPSRSTREAFERDHEFVDRRYHRYVTILAERLNEVHGVCRDRSFWQKTLSLSLLRHITFCYDLFQVCEANLRPDTHDCRILAERSFSVPDNFNAHRHFFQHTNFGQEQLFAAYCRSFHPGSFTEFDDVHQWPAPSAAEAGGKRPLHGMAPFHPVRIVRRLLRFRQPTIAVIKSFFSESNLNQLLLRSRGRIQYVQMPAVPPPSTSIDVSRRNALCRDGEGFDRFDRFAFAAFQHGMPKALVEDFDAQCKCYSRFLDRLKEVRWIVCEAWIGDAGSAMLLALAAERGIRHLYNEHNYLGHPFLGNNLKYLLPLVDEFATLGWGDGRAPNLVPAASLFPWVEDTGTSPRQDILYVASIPLARAPEINASYGESGAVNAPSYLAFIRTFLSRLSDATLNQTVLRKYPTRHARVMQAYDMDHALGDQFARMKRVDEGARPARALMQEARLVIADYISTTYLEALMSDIPSVFFWNRDAYHLEPSCANFFDGLQRAGICHTDPVAAARFVETIKDEPRTWWQSSAVREARSDFLQQNLGAAEKMIQHLLWRCRT